MLAGSGVVPLHEISAWLGHTDIKTTSILRAKSTGMHAADRLERFRDQDQQRKREEQKAKRRSRPSGQSRSVPKICG